ncbi:MAG TPA: nuclear transport factor 2 family protein [Gaiellaceae bacterium]|nr:nuclear transport factor 2 family protein [Gaiellaceae bacterium]
MVTVADAFHALFRSFCEERDAAAFAALWVVDDPSVTMWGSDQWEQAEGPDAVRRLGETLAGDEEELGFEWDELQIHERAEVAWVNARGSIFVGGERSPYRMTAVLLHTYAGWRWHTFNGSIPD